MTLYSVHLSSIQGDIMLRLQPLSGNSAAAAKVILRFPLPCPINFPVEFHHIGRTISAKAAF